MEINEPLEQSEKARRREGRREKMTKEEIGANPVGGKDTDGETEDPTERTNQGEGEGDRKREKEREIEKREKNPPNRREPTSSLAKQCGFFEDVNCLVLGKLTWLGSLD